MSAINFFKEDVDIDLRSLRPLRPWIISISTTYEQAIESVNYIFCSDQFLHQINKEYLNHDTFTDIITFDLREGNSSAPIEADIFISLDRVKENAQRLNESYKRELARVMIHGLLHLIGFTDKSREEKLIMRAKEDLALNELSVPRGTLN